MYTALLSSKIQNRFLNAPPERPQNELVDNSVFDYIDECLYRTLSIPSTSIHSDLSDLKKSVAGSCSRVAFEYIVFAITRIDAYVYKQTNEPLPAIKCLNECIVNCPRWQGQHAGGLADALIMITECYSSLGNSKEALHSARLAVDVAHNRLESIKKIGMAGGKGINRMHQVNPFHGRSLSLGPALDEGCAIAAAYNCLAIQLQGQGLFPLAKEWNHRALKSARKFNLPRETVEILKSLGEATVSTAVAIGPGGNLENSMSLESPHSTHPMGFTVATTDDAIEAADSFTSLQPCVDTSRGGAIETVATEQPKRRTRPRSALSPSSEWMHESQHYQKRAQRGAKLGRDRPEDARHAGIDPTTNRGTLRPKSAISKLGGGEGFGLSASRRSTPTSSPAPISRKTHATLLNFDETVSIERPVPDLHAAVEMLDTASASASRWFESQRTDEEFVVATPLSLLRFRSTVNSHAEGGRGKAPKFAPGLTTAPYLSAAPPEYSESKTIKPAMMLTTHQSGAPLQRIEAIERNASSPHWAEIESEIVRRTDALHQQLQAERKAAESVRQQAEKNLRQEKKRLAAQMHEQLEAKKRELKSETAGLAEELTLCTQFSSGMRVFVHPVDCASGGASDVRAPLVAQITVCRPKCLFDVKYEAPYVPDPAFPQTKQSGEQYVHVRRLQVMGPITEHSIISTRCLTDDAAELRESDDSHRFSSTFASQGVLKSDPLPHARKSHVAHFQRQRNLVDMEAFMERILLSHDLAKPRRENERNAVQKHQAVVIQKHIRGYLCRNNRALRRLMDRHRALCVREKRVAMQERTYLPHSAQSPDPQLLVSHGNTLPYMLPSLHDAQYMLYSDDKRRFELPLSLAYGDEGAFNVPGSASVLTASIGNTADGLEDIYLDGDGDGDVEFDEASPPFQYQSWQRDVEYRLNDEPSSQAARAPSEYARHDSYQQAMPLEWLDDEHGHVVQTARDVRDFSSSVSRTEDEMRQQLVACLQAIESIPLMSLTIASHDPFSSTVRPSAASTPSAGRQIRKFAHVVPHDGDFSYRELFCLPVLNQASADLTLLLEKPSQGAAVKCEAHIRGDDIHELMAREWWGNLSLTSLGRDGDHNVCISCSSIAVDEILRLFVDLWETYTAWVANCMLLNTSNVELLMEGLCLEFSQGIDEEKAQSAVSQTDQRKAIEQKLSILFSGLPYTSSAIEASHKAHANVSAELESLISDCLSNWDLDERRRCLQVADGKDWRSLQNRNLIDESALPPEKALRARFETYSVLLHDRLVDLQVRESCTEPSRKSISQNLWPEVEPVLREALTDLLSSALIDHVHIASPQNLPLGAAKQPHASVATSPLDNVMAACFLTFEIAMVKVEQFPWQRLASKRRDAVDLFGLATFSDFVSAILVPSDVVGYDRLESFNAVNAIVQSAVARNCDSKAAGDAAGPGLDGRKRASCVIM